VRRRREPETPRTLADFSIHHKLAWASGLWEPRGLWRDRAHYLADYAAVRAEFLAERHSSSLAWAERCLLFGEAHGAKALAAATDNEIRAAIPDPPPPPLWQWKPSAELIAAVRGGPSTSPETPKPRAEPGAARLNPLSKESIEATPTSGGAVPRVGRQRLRGCAGASRRPEEQAR
jgi:hypothetical protein